jgi:hypothetical protein
MRSMKVIVTTFSTIAPEPITWLWPAYIPAGMLTLLDGDPGLGKSLVTLDLAARVTRGQAMPTDEPDGGRRPRGVVLLSAEDDPARTIRPRLDSAGADAHLVGMLGLQEPGGPAREPEISARDLRAAEDAVRDLDAALVVVDPLVAYLPDAVNPNLDHAVRRALRPLAELAARTGAAVVGVRHLRKGSTDNPLYRGGGSIGIIGAARAGLLIARDPDDPSGARRILAGTKSNLGPLPPSLAFTVSAAAGAGQPHISWQGRSAHRAEDLLVAPTDAAERTAVDDAMDFLRQRLADGAVAVTVLRQEATTADIAWRTLERAKARLRVHSFRPEGFTAPWSWALPTTYAATSARTPPTPQDGGVHEDMAEYGAAATTSRELSPPPSASSSRSSRAADARGPSAGDMAAGWRCPLDPTGVGHLPALRPDGSLCCGTCHP